MYASPVLLDRLSSLVACWTQVMRCLARANAATYRLSATRLSGCKTGAPSPADVDRPDPQASAKRLGYQIGRCGGVVVTGMARGIDSVAAEGALSANAPVIGGYSVLVAHRLQ